MAILLTSVVICVILVLVSVLHIMTRQPKKLQGELIRLSETVITAVMGGMLILMGFFILTMKFVDPKIAGTDLTSYLFVGIFAVVSVAGGCAIMFYTFLQKIIACEDRIVFVSILGKTKELHWKEIIEIKTSLMSNRITLIGKKSKFSVGGEPKRYKEFLIIAKKKIRPEVGSDVLQNLLNRSPS